MEYLLGSLITLFVAYVVNKTVSKEISSIRPQNRVQLSQSRLYTLIRPALMFEAMMQTSVPGQSLETQSTKHFDSTHKRVVLTKDSAYWIEPNGLVCADYVDGQIIQESVKRVDTMALDSVKLEELEEIVQALTEGTADEHRNPGD